MYRICTIQVKIASVILLTAPPAPAAGLDRGKSGGNAASGALSRLTYLFCASV